MASNKMQDELLKLNWKNFSEYPLNGESIVVHVVGYDTNEKEWVHLFVKVRHFNAMNFPNSEVVKQTNKHHAKWTYLWLPSETVHNMFDKKCE